MAARCRLPERAAPPLPRDAEGRACRPFITPEVCAALRAGHWRPTSGLDGLEAYAEISPRRLVVNQDMEQRVAASEARMEHVRALAAKIRAGQRDLDAGAISHTSAKSGRRGKYEFIGVESGVETALAVRMARRKVRAWVSIGNDCDLLQRETTFPFALPPRKAPK